MHFKTDKLHKFTYCWSSESVCVWSPCMWAGPEHCVTVSLWKCDSLLMTGQRLCTNGCRCVDGGRTSPVTVLISSCARGSFQQLCPYRRVRCIHWQHRSTFHMRPSGVNGKKRRQREGGKLNKVGAEEENPWKQVFKMTLWWIRPLSLWASAFHFLEISNWHSIQNGFRSLEFD